MATTDTKHIHIDESFIACPNRIYSGLDLNLNLEIELDTEAQDKGAPLHMLKDDSGLEIAVHRTVRMPDDDRLHQLLGSFGTFPLFNVDAKKDALRPEIKEKEGVLLPMWQREAMWIDFLQCVSPLAGSTPYLVWKWTINQRTEMATESRTISLCPSKIGLTASVLRQGLYDNEELKF